MNYPIWELPASGLLIAAVAIVHVFISHFAVGGGLFLVVTERRARRTRDADLLRYVKFHTRFFVLLTLVLGALTGVGIWFTIALVHPQATSALIQTWVWAWAIEWTFFFVEIAAAMVYYYGWDRLDEKTHLAVGWVYFASAWMSLVVINGILTYMLTPGAWPTTRDLLDGFFNPTYWPGLVARTFAAIGLAGLYALLTSAWIADTGLRARVADYAAFAWVLPMAVALPVALVWYLAAAGAAGVDVAGVLGSPSAGPLDLLRSLAGPSSAGHPIVRLAAQASLVASLATVVFTVLIVALRHRVAAPLLAALAMIAGFVSLGGAEWVREGLRKPYVIGRVMFVNGVRLPTPDTAPPLSRPDPFAIDQLNETGVIAASLWALPVDDSGLPNATIEHRAERGREVFRLLCSACHTVDGHLGVRPLVEGRSVEAIEATLARLASPVDARGEATSWSNPDLRLTTWRGRQMPPLAGTADERRALATYLALVGGARTEDLTFEPASGTEPGGADGAAFFEANCSMCHGREGEWPMHARQPRTLDAFYELLGRLPEVNEMMPPFEGTDAERRAVAAHLSKLAVGK